MNLVAVIQWVERKLKSDLIKLEGGKDCKVLPILTVIEAGSRRCANRRKKGLSVLVTRSLGRALLRRFGSLEGRNAARLTGWKPDPPRAESVLPAQAGRP